MLEPVHGAPVRGGLGVPRQRGNVRQPLAQATQDFLVGFGDLCVGHPSRASS